MASFRPLLTILTVTAAAGAAEAAAAGTASQPSQSSCASQGAGNEANQCEDDSSASLLQLRHRHGEVPLSAASTPISPSGRAFWRGSEKGIALSAEATAVWKAALDSLVDERRAFNASDRMRAGGLWWKEYGEDPEVAAREIVDQMTFEEKKRLIIGVGMSWNDYHPADGFYAGTVLDVPRLGVPATNAQDAGQGFRTFDRRMVGTVTSWPGGLAAASAWDPELTERYASAIGKEFRRKKVNAVLGPSLDIARVGRGGRNSESLMGEEPSFGAAQAAAYVRGMQGAKVACVAKHFIMNTQETFRNSHNNEASARVRFEIHYPAFKAAFEEGMASVMCSYNGVNGPKACENSPLLQQDLKAFLHFKGYVMSDWWAVSDKRTAARSGLDLMMPGNDPSGNTPIWTDDDLRNIAGKEHMDDMARRFLTGMLGAGAFDEPVCTPGTDTNCESFLYVDVSTDEDRELAREVAAASVVLLKNDLGLLPLRKNVRMAVVGSACYQLQKQDPGKMVWNEGDYYTVGGSGRVLSPWTTSVGKALEEMGVVKNSDNSDSVDRAMDQIRGGGIDVVVTCGGVSSGEDDDRENLRLDQNDYIVKLAQRNAAETQVPLVVVTLSTGSILTDFRDNSDAILSTFMTGQATGQAVADVLFGKVNPSGRLAVTFPMQEGDLVPVCEEKVCDLYDGLYVGWRNLEGWPVAFPFGYGMSYTTFKYSWDQEPDLSSGSEATATMKIKVENTGDVAGREVVQLYIGFPSYSGEPPRMLRSFARTKVLEKGESEIVEFTLKEKDFSIWNDCTSNAFCEAKTCWGDQCSTCEERMYWLMSWDGGSLTCDEARDQIAIVEFPDLCSHCQPDCDQASGGGSPGGGGIDAPNKYLGCYKDEMWDRDLPVDKGKGDFDYCSQQCQGYKYFGRQWEQECFCGDSFGKHGDGYTCDCESDNIGGGVNCVYEVETKHDEAEYLGCFADTMEDRDMEVSKGTGDFSFCMRACEGYAYFGRQWEQECFCSNSYGKFGKADTCKCDAFNIGGHVNCVYQPKGTEPDSTTKSTTAGPPGPSTTTTTTSHVPCSDGWKLVDGDFKLWVGSSSRDDRLSTSLSLMDPQAKEAPSKKAPAKKAKAKEAESLLLSKNMKKTK